MDLLQIVYGLLGAIIGVILGESVAKVLLHLDIQWGIGLGAVCGIGVGMLAMKFYPSDETILRR